MIYEGGSILDANVCPVPQPLPLPDYTVIIHQ